MRGGKYTAEALRLAGADHVLATLEESLPGLLDLPDSLESDG